MLSPSSSLRVFQICYVLACANKAVTVLIKLKLLAQENIEQRVTKKWILKVTCASCKPK